MKGISLSRPLQPLFLYRPTSIGNCLIERVIATKLILVKRLQQDVDNRHREVSQSVSQRRQKAIKAHNRGTNIIKPFSSRRIFQSAVQTTEDTNSIVNGLGHIESMRFIVTVSMLLWSLRDPIATAHRTGARKIILAWRAGIFASDRVVIRFVYAIYRT